MSSNLESLGTAIKRAQERNNNIVRAEFDSTPNRDLAEVNEMVDDLKLTLNSSKAAFRQLNNDRTDEVFKVIDNLEVSLTDKEKEDGKRNLIELAGAIDELDADVVKNLADWKNSANDLLDDVKFRFGTTAQFLDNFNPNYGADAVSLSAIDSVMEAIHNAIDANQSQLS
tara:strand:+ start:7194 stop:7703 length:510 start_codon:yes stop_codon:yes gene_type:complete